MQLSMFRITEYVNNMDVITFKADNKTIDAVVRNFEVIGEALKKLPNFIKSKYPAIPWKEMYYLRNKISHEYFGIDYDIIWDLATNYIPDNKKRYRPDN